MWIKNFGVFFLLCVSFERAHALKEVIQIREFKNHRQYKIGRKEFLINKKSLDIFSEHSGRILKLNHNGKFNLVSFNKTQGNKEHSIYFKVNKSGKKTIGYFGRELSKFYYGNNCSIANSCIDNANKLANSDFKKSLANLTVSKLFDTDSCKSMLPGEITKFTEILENSFQMKGGNLETCYRSSEAQAIFETDPVLKQNADEVLGRFLSLTEHISKGTSPLKIKCGMQPEDKNKIASFSENPLVIALRVSEGKFNLGTSSNEVLNHELFHLGMPQFKVKNELKPNCLDEGFVGLLDQTCKYNSSMAVNLKPKLSSSIVEKCLLDKDSTITKIQTNSVAEKHPETLPILKELAELPQANGGEAAAISAELKAKPETIFVPISEPEIRAIAAVPVTTISGESIAKFEGDGQFHQVVGSNEFESNVRVISDNLGKSMFNADSLITGALGSKGKAVVAAAVGLPAVSSTGKFGADKLPGDNSERVGIMDSTQIFLSRYLPDSKELQKLDSMTDIDAQKYLSALNQGAGGSAVLTTTGSTLSSGAEKKAVSTNSLNKKIKLDDKIDFDPSAKTATRGIASIGGTTPVAVPTDKDENEKPVAPVTKAASPASPSAPSRLDNPMIQRLAVLSSVNGNDYVAIATKYRSDPAFRKQLNDRSIRIENSLGKPLWASVAQPEKCFVDTSKNLKQVACK